MEIRIVYGSKIEERTSLNAIGGRIEPPLLADTIENEDVHLAKHLLEGTVHPTNKPQ